MVDLKTLQNNIFHFSVGELISRILNFIAFVIIARTLLIEDFGALNFAIVIVSCFTIMLGFIHDDIATRELSKGISDEIDFRNNVITLRLILGIILYLILFMIYFFINYSEQIKSFTLLYGLTIISNALYTNWFFRAKENYLVISISLILSSIVNLICVIIFIHGSNDSKIAVWIITGKEILNSLILLIFYLRKGTAFSFTLKNNLTKLLLKQSFPLALIAILILVNFNINQIMLGIISGTKEVGYYSAAAKFVLLAYIPSSIIYQSFLPQLSKNANDEKSFGLLMSDYSRLLFGLGLLIAAGGYLFSREIINLTYSSTYNYSVPLLEILMFGVLINYFYKVYGSSFISSGRQSIFFIAILVGVLSNIISNLILIPRYASLGAAYSTVISELVVLILLLFFHKKYFKQLYLLNLMKVIIISVLLFTMTKALAYFDITKLWLLIIYFLIVLAAAIDNKKFLFTNKISLKDNY